MKKKKANVTVSADKYYRNPKKKPGKKKPWKLIKTSKNLF